MTIDEIMNLVIWYGTERVLDYVGAPADTKEHLRDIRKAIEFLVSEKED